MAPLAESRYTVAQDVWCPIITCYVTASKKVYSTRRCHQNKNPEKAG